MLSCFGSINSDAGDHILIKLKDNVFGISPKHGYQKSGVQSCLKM